MAFKKCYFAYFLLLIFQIHANNNDIIIEHNNSVPIYYSTFSYDKHIDSIKCVHEGISLGEEYSDLCIVNQNNCSRHIIDGYFSLNEVNSLLEIANKGMSTRPNIGGPTIVDINTGYIRDSQGLENLFTRSNDIYDTNDFQNYGNIINKLKNLLIKTFSISNLYFTAPTFITRLDGNESWIAKEIHDEYWHPHADMINTPHYHYSGLLYLSDYNVDFNGGRLLFINENLSQYNENSNYSHLVDLADEIIEPRKGRVVLFTSGKENSHFVERVTKGQRFVLAFWFTCNSQRQFEIFLDGKEHKTFSYKIKNSKMKNKNSKNDL